MTTPTPPAAGVLLAAIDTTVGFCAPGYPLYVGGAEQVGPALDGFIQRLANQPTLVQRALVTNDCHFQAEYAYSPESEVFPFHQGYGTPERDYTFDVTALARLLPTDELHKNQFDMWAEPLTTPKLAWTEMDEAHAYAKLFMPKRLAPDAPVGRGATYMTRTAWLDDLRAQGIATWLLTGVATDYCVYCALVGALEHGFNAVVLTDLVAGIYVPSIPGGAGRYDPPGGYPGVANLEQLITARPRLRAAVAAGQLRVMTSQAWLSAAA